MSIKKMNTTKLHKYTGRSSRCPAEGILNCEPESPGGTTSTARKSGKSDQLLTKTTGHFDSRAVYFVIDDDDAFRNRLVSALESRGFTATGFSTGRLALDNNNETPAPDRIILDLRLADESGLELLPELLVAYPEVQILLLTGFGSIATAVDAMKRGAKYFLTKPVGLDEILQAFSETPKQKSTSENSVPSLDEVEWEHIQRVMNLHEGNITHAAKALGMHRRSLQRKLARGNPLN